MDSGGNSKLISLEDIYPSWAGILDYYEDLFSSLKRKISSRVEWEREEESLFWECWVFELILTVSITSKISVVATKVDVRPKVKDFDGNDLEIDFRLTIADEPVYFGVTHFREREKDLKKNVEGVDVKVWDLRRGTSVKMEPANGEGKLVSWRSQNEYLNRRMTTRVAKEGNHSFPNTYIYVFIPKLDRGFGGGLDSVPADFNFSSKANYEYASKGINGIILLGHPVDKTARSSWINMDEIIIKTHMLSGCSNTMASLLRGMNDVRLDIKDRMENVLKNKK